MSDWEITSALAPTFRWAQTDGTLRVSFDAGSPDHIDVELATGTYRMHLGPTSGAGKDFIRAVAAAINSAIAAEGRSEICTLTMGADGHVVFEWSTTGVSVDTNPILAMMGFPAGGAGTLVGAYAPRYLALMIAQSGGVWQPVQTGATDVTSAGRPYTIGEVTTAFTKRPKVDFIPRDPEAADEADGCPATPWYPDRALWGTLGDTSTVRRWSWLDVLRASANVECAVTLGDWQDLLTSTTRRYDLVRIGKASVRNPKPERQDDRWDRWYRHDLELWLPDGAPSGTRG